MELPKYSPDLHQLPEHVNDHVKETLMKACTINNWMILDFEQILAIVSGVMLTVTPDMIQQDIGNLIRCYQIVSTDEGKAVEGLKNVTGSGGGYVAHIFS